MKVTPSGPFQRDLKKLSRQDATDVINAIARFMTSPNHPALNFEQVKSRKGYFSIRANLRVRVLLKREETESFVAVAVGSHDYVYASYFKK